MLGEPTSRSQEFISQLVLFLLMISANAYNIHLCVQVKYKMMFAYQNSIMSLYNFIADCRQLSYLQIHTYNNLLPIDYDIYINFSL